MNKKLNTQLDISFLLARAENAGFWQVKNQRDCGSSANSLVSIAYGSISLDKLILPSDKEDQQACIIAWEKLPEHRKTVNARKAMATINRLKF